MSQAERGEVRPYGEIYGELLPDVALVDAIGDLAWSRTSLEVLSWYAGVRGNLADFPNSPALTPVGR